MHAKPVSTSQPVSTVSTSQPDAGSKYQFTLPISTYLFSSVSSVSQLHEDNVPLFTISFFVLVTCLLVNQYCKEKLNVYHSWEF